MNKEKLIEKMREDMTEISNRPYPFQTTADFLINEFAEACAELALKELDNEWVRVSDAKPHHRQPLWLKAKEFDYAIHGYYNDIISVFHAYSNPEYDGHKHTVTHVLPINLPSPPKDK